MKASFGSRRLARDRSAAVHCTAVIKMSQRIGTAGPFSAVGVVDAGMYQTVYKKYSLQIIFYALVSAGSRELECAIGHLDVSLDPKRTCFSIMNIWLENSCMDVMTGVYCCSPKTPSLRRADLLRRFLFMARKAAAEHTKGNLILFVSFFSAR
ncbi:unnamed protein product [Toxocara canis]|uniref:DUF3707 domain-containing protein n=1 Tax=Toxocara canis TaxID=6265 RepID=A0A183UNY8_TOXCA|nr:unnamed protein product [Toxocara canis]